MGMLISSFTNKPLRCLKRTLGVPKSVLKILSGKVSKDTGLLLGPSRQSLSGLGIFSRNWALSTMPVSSPLKRISTAYLLLLVSPTTLNTKGELSSFWKSLRQQCVFSIRTFLLPAAFISEPFPTPVSYTHLRAHE